MEYLVSVVVPTKNRYKYLKELVALIDGFHLSELELVIQDNSDNNAEILEYLKGFDNDNIHYYYSTDQLTMSTNADAGIRHAQGEYICFIGDDDGVCRNIVECVKWMKANGIDGVRTSQTIFTYNDASENPSKLSIFYQGNVAKLENPMSRLRQAMCRGLVLSDCHIPMVYQSIIKKSILDIIFKKGGTHFPGVVPDVSGGVCSCFELKKYAVVGVPVVINGLSSSGSGGVNKQKANGVLNLEEVKFIKQEDRDDWDNRLPRIWYSSFVWSDAGIKALVYMGAKEMADKVNVEYSLARALRYHPWLKTEIVKASRNRLALCYWCVWQTVRRYWNALLNRTVKRQHFTIKYDLNSIEACENFISGRVGGSTFSGIIIR